jgi:hypothetical protein
MRPCPYCGYSNYDNAGECRHCQASFIHKDSTLYEEPTGYWFGPQKARAIRSKALSAIVLALLMKVYWGGYGPWPVIEPPFLNVRSWLEPLLLYGGAAGYIIGWILNWI